DSGLWCMVAGVSRAGGARAVAAAGFLPPVAGAVLQEGIDVVVILNALRALSGPAEWRRRPIAGLPAGMGDGHRRLLPVVDRVRHVAHRNCAVAPAGGHPGLGRLVGPLREGPPSPPAARGHPPLAPLAHA